MLSSSICPWLLLWRLLSHLVRPLTAVEDLLLSPSLDIPNCDLDNREGLPNWLPSGQESAAKSLKFTQITKPLPNP